MTGLILLFFVSLFAWIDGDDSMKWYVIAVVIFVAFAYMLGSCSA